jgi:two-component system LytT family sensor kinase
MNSIAPSHGQLLANTVGHGAGVLLFGIALWLLMQRRGGRAGVWAAWLALIWNLASLVSLGLGNEARMGKAAADSLAFAALSLLPAVLLELSVGSAFRLATRLGYVVSTLAAVLHATELVVDESGIHRTGLWMITGGFATLTLYCFARTGRPRLAGSMALFLLAVSFSHFGVHTEQAWPVELGVHHAGIPLALLILMQDVRFVLADALVRFLANVLLAGVFVGLGVSGWQLGGSLWPEGAFGQGLLLLAGCCGLILYAVARSRLQAVLTSVVFKRRDPAEAARGLEKLAGDSSNEEEFLRKAELHLADWIGAPLLPDGDRAEVTLPLRLSRGSKHSLRLGERLGGRRYLSEDLEALAMLTARIGELADQMSEAELRRLVSQAELRALQAQIHPHFLFNALNTLYGVIPKQADAARRMVLNLSDLFRYFLKPDRALIAVEEELRIVEAYLEIEKLRLGDKLSISIDVEERARGVPIPVLCIQPLVENAVKHGVARNAAPGRVTIHVRREGDQVSVTVEDTGAGEHGGADQEGTGTGIENVRKRLQHWYGEEAALEFDSSRDGTRVRIRFPVEVAR